MVEVRIRARGYGDNLDLKRGEYRVPKTGSLLGFLKTGIAKKRVRMKIEIEGEKKGTHWLGKNPRDAQFKI